MDDDRPLDSTARLLGDFVRQVSGQVVVPEFAPRPGSSRRRRAPGPRRVLAVALATAAVVGAVALVAAYGPRSSSPGPRRVPATQPAPGTTVPTPTSTRPTPTSTQPPPPAAPTTAMITYAPFTATGAVDPALHVTSRVTGTCIRYSRGPTPRVYYRCFAGGSGIYDPCFAGPQATTAPLVCPTSPLSSDVTEFTVTSITSTGTPSPSVMPWAMQLSDGQVCLLVSAAWGGLGPYGCQPPPTGSSPTQPAVDDCHTPAAAQPSWTAACQKQEVAASPFTAHDVVALWF